MTPAKTLIVRADAGAAMGTGHVMRCLALARAWQASGGRVTFVTHCPVQGLRERIAAAGAQLVEVEQPHPHPRDLDVTRAVVAAETAAAEKGGSAPVWVALDGYHFDAAYQQAVRDTGCRLLVIDDRVEWRQVDNLPHIDLLLNQNLGAERITYPCDAAVVLLLGSRYVLLQPGFATWREFRRELAPVAARVLVTLGGSDPDNVTQTVLKALDLVDRPGLTIKVVVGAANPHRAALSQETSCGVGVPPAPGNRNPHPPNIELLSDVQDMAALMAWANVAISAAGTTCWELAFMQLPAIVLVVAANQRPIAAALADAGTVLNLGDARQTTPAAIAAALTALCQDRQQRGAQSAAGRRLIDGLGTERVVAVMRAFDRHAENTIQLRPVEPDDLLPLWRLANDPTVRRHSLSTAPIPLDVHTEWFESRLRSPDSRLWVLDLDGLILGVIRYDRAQRDTAEISFSVAGAFRGRGLGSRLIAETQELAREQLRVHRLRAVVRQENLPAERVFAKAGFARVDFRPIKNQPCYIFERSVP